MVAGPGHGDGGERELGLLRADPPAAALAWVERTRGDSVVTGVVAMRRGTSAAMHRVTLRDRAGHEQTVVLRRYVRQPREDEAGSPAQFEANALSHVAAASFPTP